MNNIMKAEWLRLRKSNHFPFYSLVIWLCLAVFPLVTLLGGDSLNVSTYLVSVYDVVAIFIPFFIGAFISICIAFNYINRTAYYEIMSGKSTNAILISRIIVYTVYMAVGLFAFMGVIIAIIGATGGKGDMDKMPVRILLFAVVITHICITSVLLSMAGHSLLAPIFIFLRFEVFEGIFTMLVPQIMTEVMDCNENTIATYSNYFVVSQIGSVFKSKIDADLVLAVVLSLVFETVLWYIAATISFRKSEW